MMNRHQELLNLLELASRDLGEFRNQVIGADLTRSEARQLLEDLIEAYLLGGLAVILRLYPDIESWPASNNQLAGLFHALDVEIDGAVQMDEVVSLELVGLLLDFGWDPLARDHLGRTCIDVLRERAPGHPELVVRFLQRVPKQDSETQRP